MHDLALTLDARGILASDLPGLWRIFVRSLRAEWRGPSDPEAVSLRTFARCLKTRVEEQGWRGTPRGPILNAFRTDREQVDIQLPVDNVDISQIFSFGTHSSFAAMLAARAFIAFIDRYDEVRTNRLHVGIGAALLGKEVKFYPNSYYKNKAVYDFSLKDFPNIRWMGLPL